MVIQVSCIHYLSTYSPVIHIFTAAQIRSSPRLSVIITLRLAGLAMEISVQVADRSVCARICHATHTVLATSRAGGEE